MLPTLQAKIAAAVVGAVFFTICGIGIGHRLDLGQIAAMRATLAQQQAADAQAVAQADTLAAHQMQAAQVAEASAESAAMVSRQQAQDRAGLIAAHIAAQAAQPGQDGTVAPVLASTLANLGGAP